MYELDYLRKRKRRRSVTIVGGISTVVVATFVIVAFLGRFVGTFTVNLESRNVDLALTKTEDSDEGTTFMRLDVASPFNEFTYTYFDRMYGGDASLDNEETPYTYGANMEGEEVKSFNFFKYTFYLENKGIRPAQFDWYLNIVENVKSFDGQSLLDTLRVMVYVDGNRTIYGKAEPEERLIERRDGTVEMSDCPPVSVESKEAGTTLYPFEYYTDDVFISSSVITSFENQNIDVGQAIRYTVVFWLEGFRSANDQLAPTGARLKLGVDINAYEIQ